MGFHTILAEFESEHSNFRERVFRIESEEDNSDSFSVESFELSQKQREFGAEYADYGDYGNSKPSEVSGGAGGAAKGGLGGAPSTDILMRRQDNEFTYLTKRAGAGNNQQQNNEETNQLMYMILDKGTGDGE